jgi:transketolase
MRNTFSEALYEAATKDASIYIVVSDISPAGSMAKFSSHIPTASSTSASPSRA